MNWRKVLLFVAFTLLFVGGCVGPTSGLKSVQRPKAYANIVSLSPSTTEILCATGGSPLLVGRTSSCDRPAVISNVQIVADSKPDYEAIMGTDPDLIIYDTMLYSDDEIAKIEALGVETLAYDVDSIADFEKFCHKLASRIGFEMRMSVHLDKIYKEIAAAQANDTGDPRTTILLDTEGSGDYLVMGVSGIHSAIIEAAGGVPVGAEGRRFQQMNLEKLIGEDPEIIFTDGIAVEIMEDPRLQGVAAVKERHVYNVNRSTLVRIGQDIIPLIKGMNEYLTVKPTAKFEEGE